MTASGPRRGGPSAGRIVLRCQTDARLVELVRAGNDAAFEAVVERYRAPLLRYCRRLLPEGRAEDAVQQAFLNAYTSIGNDSEHLNLRPWLYRIAHNAAVDALRQNGWNYERLPMDRDGVERPDQALERMDELRSVLRRVGALPERQRAAILLRELEGRSYDEIACELGVTGGAVRQLLNRARTAVRAGATALTPAELLVRAPWNALNQPAAARIAELCAAPAAGAGTGVATVCAAVVVAGGVVGGATPGTLGVGDRDGGGDGVSAAAAAPAPTGATTSGAGIQGAPPAGTYGALTGRPPSTGRDPTAAEGESGGRGESGVRGDTGSGPRPPSPGGDPGGGRSKEDADDREGGGKHGSDGGGDKGDAPDDDGDDRGGKDGSSGKDGGEASGSSDGDGEGSGEKGEDERKGEADPDEDSGQGGGSGEESEPEEEPEEEPEQDPDEEDEDRDP